MSSVPMTVERARDDVSASSAGGSPFLLAYGVTMLACAALALVLPRSTAALIAMFQGGVALPAAFWLERRLRARPASAANPLRQLSGQLAMSQAAALPAVIVAYSLDPGAVPVVLGAIGGAHFVPYTWLHRAQVYAVLAAAVSLGAFALQVVLRDGAFAVILAFIGAAYLVAAPLAYRRAAQLVAASQTG